MKYSCDVEIKVRYSEGLSRIVGRIDRKVASRSRIVGKVRKGSIVL